MRNKTIVMTCLVQDLKETKYSDRNHSHHQWCIICFSGQKFKHCSCLSSKMVQSIPWRIRGEPWLLGGMSKGHWALCSLTPNKASAPHLPSSRAQHTYTKKSRGVRSPGLAVVPPR